MSRDNSRDVSSLEVTLRGSQVDIDPIANGTKPFDDVKVMLLKGDKGDQGEPGTGANPETNNPLMNGTASAGSSDAWSRGDHIHPSDTSRVAKSGDLMTGELFYGSAYIGTASSKSTNKIEASLDGSEITCTLYRSPLPSTQEITDMPSGYTACRINLFESDGTTLIADKVLFDGDEWTYDLGSVTSIKLRIDFLAISTFGEEIIDGNGNQLSLKADTATVEAELAEKADISDISSEKTVTGNPITLTDALPVPVKSLVANVEPIQDLHGQPYPYVGGAYKNILQTTLDNIKSINTSGTWSGNTYTYRGISYTVLTDSADNVIGVKVTSGTASDTSELKLQSNFSSSTGTTYYLNGCPSGGSESTYKLTWYYHGYDTGSGLTSNGGNDSRIVSIEISSGYSIPSGGLLFQPMIRTSGDTTFAPYSNICPISGWTECKVTRCGKNLAGDWTEDIVIDYNTGKFLNNTSYHTTGWIPVKQNEPVTISGKGSGGERWFYNADKTPNRRIANSDGTFTPTSDGFIRVSVAKTNTTLQIERCSTATAYEAYNGITYTIDLDGTRYGGYITVDENGVTKFVGTRAFIVYDGSSDESWSTSSGTNYYQYYISISDSVNMLSYKNNLFELNDIYYRGRRNIAISYNDHILRVALLPDMNITTLEQWKTFLASNNLQVCYFLATPIEVTLSNTNITLLDGYNNVWCDSGDVELTYLANRCYESETKLEQSEVATVESGNTASRAYAVNEFMMWKGGLYKVTQAIASGATITSGTNVTKTTIGAVLTALLNG